MPAAAARTRRRRITRSNEPPKKSDLPSTVLKTAEAEPRAIVRGYSRETEDGQLEYEVPLTVHGRSRDGSIAADGSIIEIEEQVALDSLPAAVREGLHTKGGAGKITKVEAITKHGTIACKSAPTGNRWIVSSRPVNP